MSTLAHLNPQQLRAATHDGSCLVIAGPGTGKTATLTARIQHLLTDRQIPANQILAITFTKKAAREMQGRLVDSLRRHSGDPSIDGESRINTASWTNSSTDQVLLPKDTDDKEFPFIDTLHAWCYWFLQNYHPDWQNHPKTVISEAEQKQILKQLIRKGEKEEDLVTRISKQKQLLSLSSQSHLSSRRRPGSMSELTPEILLQTQTNEGTWPMDSRLHGKDTFFVYQKHLRDKHLVDFDDLLINSLELLLEKDFAKPFYRQLLIDEFQDFTQLQFRIIQQLIHPETQVFLVGDPYQSIYGFRGASPDSVNQLCNSTYEKIDLDQNYRSHQLILDCSGSLFDPPRSLAAIRVGGPTVQLLQTSDEKTESYWISKTIQQLTGSFDHNFHNSSDDSQIRFSDIAILYRTHSLSPALQSQLAKGTLPFQVIGEKTILEYSDVSQVLAKLQDFAPENYDPNINNLSGLISYLYSQHGLDQTKPSRQRLQFLQTVANQYGNNLSPAVIDQFIRDLKFYQDSDNYQSVADKITLSTIHAAKGLEFHTVFIIGVEENLLPFHKSQDYPQQLEEEKRLFYVALTRAKQQIYLTVTRNRRIHATNQASINSRFLDLINPQYLQSVDDQFADKYGQQLAKLRQKKRQLSFL